MLLFETHVQYNRNRNLYAIRSRCIDGTDEHWFYRSLDWLEKYTDKDIPYNWEAVRANPDKWFLL